MSHDVKFRADDLLALSREYEAKPTGKVSAALAQFQGIEPGVKESLTPPPEREPQIVGRAANAALPGSPLRDRAVLEALLKLQRQAELRPKPRVFRSR